MKKIIMMVLGVFIVATSAMAKQDGFFVGGQLSLASVKDEVEVIGYGPVFNRGDSSSIRAKAAAYVGYKHYIADSFGLRYYPKFSLGGNYWIVDANADALYEFTDALGVFAGLGLGMGSGNLVKTWGVEYGINLGGIYTLNSEKMSVEFAARIGLSKHEETFLRDFKYKSSQPFEVGIRVTIFLDDTL